MNINYKTPEELKLLTDKSRPETNAFLKKLKKKKPKRLDDVVHALHYEAFDNFDCLDCANCCKTIGPRLFDKDIERLAKHLKMKVADFMGHYIKTDEDGDFVLTHTPALFFCPTIIVWCTKAAQKPAENTRTPIVNVFTRFLTCRIKIVKPARWFWKFLKR